MEQKIEGGDLDLVLNSIGAGANITADKVVYESNNLTFFLMGSKTMHIRLKKQYKTIYEALASVGISAKGY